MKTAYKPLTFFTLSLILPWALWFIVAYWSHQPISPSHWWHITLELAGLLTPIVVAAILFMRNKALLADLHQRFIGKGLLCNRYFWIAVLLPPISSGGANSLSWRRSWPRTILHIGAAHFLVCSPFGMVCTLFCTRSRRIGMAHVRHRRLTPTLYALYHVDHFHHLLGLMASTPFLYKGLLSKQHTGRGVDIHAQFLCKSVYLHLYH